MPQIRVTNLRPVKITIPQPLNGTLLPGQTSKFVYADLSALEQSAEFKSAVARNIIKVEVVDSADTPDTIEVARLESLRRYGFVELRAASGFIGAGCGVYCNVNDYVSAGDASDTGVKSNIVGVAVQDTVHLQQAPIITFGIAPNVLSGAQPGVAYFLNVGNGAPVLRSSLPRGSRLIRLGFARNLTDLDVRVLDLGMKAR